MQESLPMADILPDPATSPTPAPAPPVAHVDALRPGTRLDEFEIQGLLGVGGFGLVYRAYDHSLDRTVAIKEYMPAALAARLDGASVLVRSASDQVTYQSGLQSFMAEARLLAKFDHPSLVKVYRFWEANNTAYMVMPLYSGMTLSQARSQMVAPPPEEWLRTVLWSILQGLHVLHRADTLHRDISPDNIFLQDMGPPVLLDLGAARRAISDKSHRLTAILKVNYAPIEQYAEVEDLKQGPWTDLYALAAVVYSCLRNDPPLPATTRVVRDSMPSVRRVAATVKEHFGISYSDEFVRTIQHALALQPADRPQSLAAFVTEMKLKAPPRLNKFDWRVELGASLRAEEADYNSRQFWQTQPQTLLQPAAGPKPRRRRRAGGAMRRLAWGVGLLALLGGWLLGPGSPWPTRAVTTRAEAVATPAVTDQEGAPARSPVAAEPVAATGGSGAVSPATTPAAAVPTAALATKQTTPAPTESVPAPRKPAPAKPAAGAEERKPSPRPAVRAAETPVKAASAPAAPAPVPAPAAAVDRVLCADANFFARPMCIHLECQKTENAQLPVCIEDRKRYPDGRNPTSP